MLLNNFPSPIPFMKCCSCCCWMAEWSCCKFFVFMLASVSLMMVGVVYCFFSTPAPFLVPPAKDRSIELWRSHLRLREQCIGLKLM